MRCRSNCRAMLFYAYCATISQLYVILCLLSYGAHFGLLCLLCHNKPTVCHTMPTRVPCYVYNVILKLQHLLWHTMLTNTMPIFHNKPPVSHNLPTKVSCYSYYNILSCSAYQARSQKFAIGGLFGGSGGGGLNEAKMKQ